MVIVLDNLLYYLDYFEGQLAFSVIFNPERFFSIKKESGY